MYQREVIRRRRSELGRKVGIEGVEIFHVDAKVGRIVNQAFSVGEHIFVALESSDELLEFAKGGVAGCSGFGIAGASSAAGKLRLVAVVHGSFVPT